MALQTSSVLSAPHFILLQAGHFTGLVQHQRAGNDRKKPWPLLFPGQNPIRAENSHVPTLTLSGITQNTAVIFTAGPGLIWRHLQRSAQGFEVSPGRRVWSGCVFAVLLPACLCVCPWRSTSLLQWCILIMSRFHDRHTQLVWPSPGRTGCFCFHLFCSLSLSPNSLRSSLRPLSLFSNLHSLGIAELSSWSAPPQTDGRNRSATSPLQHFKSTSQYLCKTNTLKGEKKR